MWMTPTSDSVGDNWMVSAATEFSGVSASIAYGDFEYEGSDGGSEFDLILGYGVTDCISLDAIYTSTDYGDGMMSKLWNLSQLTNFNPKL